MNTFSSKELYMMNGGDKLYIYKDGFADIYNATEAEEEEWKQEYIANTLVKIDNETNKIVLNSAIESLRFHKYPELNTLLLNKIKDASSLRKSVFESALSKNIQYEKSHEMKNTQNKEKND